MEFAAAEMAALLEVLDEVGVGVFIGDGHQLLEVNTTMVRLFGRERESLVGSDATAFLTPRSRVIMAEREHDWSGDVAVRRVSILRPDNQPVPAVVASTAPREGLRVGVVIDETKAVAAATDLELLQSIADHSPAAALVWDAGGVTRGVDMRLHWISQPALDALGVKREDVSGQRLGDVLPFVPSALADRALGMAGTGRVERIGESPLPTGGGGPVRIFDRMLIGLPGQRVAVRIADVTDERQEQQRQLALLRRVVAIGDEERQQLAMALHDDAIQQAAAAAVLVEGVARRPDVPDRVPRLETAASAVRYLVTVLRRLVFELSPPELLESGIEAALGSALAYLFADTDVEAILDIELPRDVDLSPSTQTTIYRIAVEALTNARKHAHASAVSVRIAVADGEVTLDVRDDGVGLLLDPGSGEPGHLGLRAMAERAEGAGGVLTIGNLPTGGVQVRAALPLAPPGRARPPIHADPPSPDVTAGLRDSLRDATKAIAATQQLAEELHGQLRDVVGLGPALLRPPLAPDDVASRAALLIAGTTGLECFVHLAGQGGRLSLSATSTSDRDLLDWITDHVDSAGHLAVVMRSGLPIQVDTSDQVPARADPLQAIAVPLTVGDQRVGALTLLSCSAVTVWSDDDLDYFVALAGQVAMAIAISRGRMLQVDD